MIFDVAVKGAHARKCYALFSSYSGCVCCYFPIRHNNKQLINSLAKSIKAQGESMKSAPASSSRSSHLGGFCRACLRYTSLSYSRPEVCRFSSPISALGNCGCARASQPPSTGKTQAPAHVFIIQQQKQPHGMVPAEKTPHTFCQELLRATSLGASPAENRNHGTGRKVPHGGGLVM